ncbi:MAG: S24 family peptidase [Acutalibacteraceae bacterium]|nr:S24 family peptidase [Acutalibacteraceae bacterium]
MKNNIKKLREQRGWSIKETAQLLQIPYTTYISYEKSERKPSPETLAKIAQLFETSIDFLVGVVSIQDVLSLSNILPIPETKQIPLLGTIACGEPIVAIENIDNYITVESKANVDFALKCKGDSMINARIFDGDIVYIHAQPDVENGEIAAVLIDNEATLKRVYKHPNKLILSPCNPIHNDLVYTDSELENIRILGKAVMFVSLVQ